MQGSIQKKLQQHWGEIAPALHDLQAESQSFGRITNEDFKRVLYGMDVGFTPRELGMLVAAVDKESYGAVDFFKFQRRVESVRGTMKPLPFFRRWVMSGGGSWWR